MKAIALTQPWATLWVGGEKINETRSWKTDYRGELAVLASKGFPGWAKELCDEEPFKSALWRLGFNRAEELPRGQLVGAVLLNECLPIVRPDDAPSINLNGAILDSVGRRWTVPYPELAFGDFTPGRFAWRATHPRGLAQPVPFKGRLGIFDVPDELLAAVA